MAMEFKVPELGENVHAATVTQVLVATGDRIVPKQAVVELETDKAALEVPSDVEGTIDRVWVKKGDEVKVGQTLLTVSVASGTEKKEIPPEKKSRPQQAPEAVESSGDKPSAAPPAAGKPIASVPAAPATRRFARELGVDLGSVPGSGPGGRIGLADIFTHARLQGPGAPPPLPDFARWGGVERKPMSTVRRLTAERLAYAWSVIPQVTQFGQADITELEQWRLQRKAEAEKAGGRLTWVAILVKTLSGALTAFPRVNSSLDPERKEIVFKQYMNVGVAMDTERGLVVPVLRDIDRKSVIDIAVELQQFVGKARDGRLTLEEMQGGTFTLSNVGSLGGDLFTPIVNWPEAAILGMARARVEPRFEDGSFKPRLILPLALSYDHRLIDGAEGARFMRWLIDALGKPGIFPAKKNRK